MALIGEYSFVLLDGLCVSIPAPTGAQVESTHACEAQSRSTHSINQLEKWMQLKLQHRANPPNECQSQFSGARFQRADIQAMATEQAFSHF